MIRAALLSLAFASPALAQSNCGPHVKVVEGLDARFGESLVATGMIDGRHIMQTFANQTTGSWTIIAIDVSGNACLVASGAMFELVAAGPAGDPA